MSNDLVNQLVAVSAPDKPNARKPTSIADRADADIPAAERQRMREAAAEFEAVFVAQMLKHAGFEKAFGEEASSFSQMLLTEVAEDMAMANDFGLADKAYEMMVARHRGGAK